MHREYRGTICQKSLGNPAIIGETPGRSVALRPVLSNGLPFSEPGQDAAKPGLKLKEFGSKR